MTEELTLEREEVLYDQGYRFIGAVDEVGRGSLAGPVSVGMVVLDMEKAQLLAGVRDSKKLTEKKRESLVEPIRTWATASAVGHASAQEIDEHGIMAALNIAGLRAYEQVLDQLGWPLDCIVIDGKYDWLNHTTEMVSEFAPEMFPLPPTKTYVKGDNLLLAIAAASVIAKVERDSLMKQFGVEHPEYSWKSNKGYGSVAHRQAIKDYGPTVFHRTSWKL